MLIFLPKNKRMLGIDISPRSIRLVEIETSGGRKSLVSNVCKEWDDHDEHGLEQLQAGVLKSLVEENGIKARKVVSVVPYRDLTERFINVPASDERKISDLVKWEVPKHIGYPVEEATYDFNHIPSEQEGSSEVHLAITRKDSVERIISLLSEAGLQPDAIETRSSALHRLVLRNPEWASKTVVFLDIEYRYTTMLVIKDGVLRMSRRIENGKRDITTSIAVLTGCEVDAAEATMAETGISKRILDGESVDPTSTQYNVYSAIERPVDRLLADARRSLEFYKAQYGDEDGPEIILISGESSDIPNLDLFVGMKMSCDTIVLKATDIEGLESDHDHDEIGAFSIALGLAMR